MNIFCISGSADEKSSNQGLLKCLPYLIKNHTFFYAEGLVDFPVFTPGRGEQAPSQVLSFKEQIKRADLVLISTPEYIHNVPAVLKNALEWITASGEFNEKKVLAITYTPSPPRGEQAMQSLVWSLQALNAKIVAQLPLHQSELKITEQGEFMGDDSVEAIKAIFEFIQD